MILYVNNIFYKVFEKFFKFLLLSKLYNLFLSFTQIIYVPSFLEPYRDTTPYFIIFY